MPLFTLDELAVATDCVRTLVPPTPAYAWPLLARRVGATVVVKHALRNALIPIITVVGLQTGFLLGGAVLTESIFAWPGVGRLAFEAISNRDYPLIIGCVLLFSATFVLVNFIVDILYALFNPRIRYV